MKMSFGNHIGFASCEDLSNDWHQCYYGFLVAELREEVDIPGVMKIG